MKPSDGWQQTAESNRLSRAQREQIESICDRFESAWQNGNAPDLASYLVRLDKELEIPGLTELVILDAHYRRRHQARMETPEQTLTLDQNGESPSAYQTQVPIDWNNYVRQ